jgi:3-oxoacyl-[acyl-carrier protein] reductase
VSRRFDGKVALVTGAGQGLGLAVASALASEGALVAVNDIDASLCEHVVAEITARGERALSLPFDVSSSSQVDDAVAHLVGETGRLDVLVNNAGFLRFPRDMRKRVRAWEDAQQRGEPWGSLETTTSTDDETWRTTIAVMLDGVFYCTRAALRVMEPAKSGAIVNVSSMGAFQRSPTAPHYAAAKAGVIAFTRSVGQEVAGAGIRVNAVAPGPFATDIAGRLPSGVTSPLAMTVPSGRLGEPSELAEVVLFLASDEASFCVGEVFTVSGGVS